MRSNQVCYLFVVSAVIGRKHIRLLPAFKAAPSSDVSGLELYQNDVVMLPSEGALCVSDMRAQSIVKAFDTMGH